jgi:UDP-glucuronate 4-epimerase
MKILVTGAAGFIGFSVSRELLRHGHEVLGIDNHNNYYDTKLKKDRVSILLGADNYRHAELDISVTAALDEAVMHFEPEVIINLAAQAGVRYSIENPRAYIDSNIIGFTNILEASKNYGVRHLVYASTSSVYGLNDNLPFHEGLSVGHPVSFYAATKRANELMAHSYSHLFGLPSTGLRFFTVYGPWGRPDMALFKFVKAIIAGEPIDVFNSGQHTRDFTYIDDIVDGIVRACMTPPDATEPRELNEGESTAPWQIFNIGNTKPVQLLDFVAAIESKLNKSAILNFLPMQKGDVPDTFSSVEKLVSAAGYSPKTDIETGISNFVDWYRSYYEC